MADRTVHRYDELEWQIPMAPGTDEAVARAAAEQGVAKKYLSQGDEGFFAQVVRIPPGLSVPPHSHDHAEIFMVLEGACHFDGADMARFDLTVVAANSSYGFRAGAEGVVFLVIRTGQATFAAG